MRNLCLVALLLALGGCRWGEPPWIPYVDRATYVEPEGTRTEIHRQAEEGVSAVTPYDGGLLVANTRWFEGTVGLAHVRGDRRTELGPCATGGGAPSPDRSRVAWLTLACPESGQRAPTLLHVGAVDGTGGWSRQLDRQSLLFVAGFVGDSVVVSGWVDPVRLVPETGPIRVVPHLRRAVDAPGTLVAGDERVVDTATGELLWRQRGVYLSGFSPDGRHLAAIGHGGRGLLLDARTGAVTAELPGRLDGLTWENDGHLLAVSRGGGFEVMVRIGLDGRAELVGPVARESAFRWTFATQP